MSDKDKDGNSPPDRIDRRRKEHTNLTDEELRQRGKIGAHARWGRTPPNSVKVEESIRKRWERKVDPNREMTPADRERAAIHAMNEHMARMALARMKAARKRRVEKPSVEKITAHEAGRRAQQRLMDRFRAEVDPEGTLPTAERESRAEARRKAYMRELNARSTDARRARKGSA